MPLGLQIFDDLCFVGRQNVSPDFVDAKAGGNGFGGAYIVAGCHNDVKAKIVQLFQGRGRCVLYRISHAQQPGKFFADNHKHYGFTVVAAGVCGVGCGARVNFQLPQHGSVAKGHGQCPHFALHAFAGQRFKILGLR